MRKLLAAIVALSQASVGPAFGYCYEPSLYSDPPSAPGSYEEADVPYCLSSYSYSRQHDCDQWELDAYQRELEEYVEKLGRYVSEATAFAQEAIDYANRAEDYAVCKAEEVAEQHE